MRGVVLSESQVRLKQDKKPAFSRAGAAMVKMVSHSPITPYMQNPTAHYPGKLLPERVQMTCQKTGQTLKQLLFPPPHFHSRFSGGTNIHIQWPSRQTPGVQSQGGTQLQGTKNTQLLSSLPPPMISGHMETAEAPEDSSQGPQGCLVQTSVSELCLS